ncbi:hypothetical protein RHSIM_RhsimUnG0140000 [Rhododendron simsii]|uniref:DNA-directed RNA polymerase n=1 Tax=Rhododendron simsii TaxID=118357 RepID=A0A834L2H7_RHOSS|nr:hypothetical protein RHSIM_RhsimUnG0140000 [Rhododendron simsii]
MDVLHAALYEQEIAHSISAREVIVCSSRGLTKPSTLLNAILRDVVICYDGTVRNVCNNSIIQFEYETKLGAKNIRAAGEPIGWFPLTVTKRSYLSLAQLSNPMISVTSKESIAKVSLNDIAGGFLIDCDSYAEFSFGVVLQELIAGPKTVGKFGDGVDIVRRVKKTISERAQWVPTSKHHKPVQDCHHVHRPEAYDEGSRAHDHQSSFARCGIASCHALAF